MRIGGRANWLSATALLHAGALVVVAAPDVYLVHMTDEFSFVKDRDV
jgi:hypothetical protein